jgi:hypothetical protein
LFGCRQLGHWGHWVLESDGIEDKNKKMGRKMKGGKALRQMVVLDFIRWKAISLTLPDQRHHPPGLAREA